MDIYFLESYGKVCESIEGGIAKVFNFSNEYGTVKNMFIKRKIPWLVNDIEYFDAVTPYGYGGPLMIEVKDEKRFTEDYLRAWDDYCKRERIVSEFVRFHPLENNAIQFSGIYNVSHNRKTVAIVLSDHEYELKQFTTGCKYEIRKAVKRGVTTVIDENLDLLDAFVELYYATMKKNNAKDYYFFSKEFFSAFKENLKDKSVIIAGYLEGRIISAALFMFGDKYMHYHLSATDPEFYKYSANNLILSEAARFGCEKGLDLLHLGGGLGGGEDGLFKFKKSFAPTGIYDFNVGKRIFNKAVYQELCRLNGISEDADFFPAYRKEPAETT